MGKKLKSADPLTLFVDRATHEFGAVYYNLNSAAIPQRLEGTEEPAFFSVKYALAACWHSKSRKVSILLEYAQVDLEFHTVEEAREFLNTFEDAAATTQNNSFCSYEHHSLRKLEDNSFNMANESISGRSFRPWMDAGSSEWTRFVNIGMVLITD